MKSTRAKLIVLAIFLVLLAVFVFLMIKYFAKYQIAQSGVIQLETIKINSKTFGKVEKINVKANQEVEEGEILIEIENAQLESKAEKLVNELDKAAFDYTKANGEFEKIKLKNKEILENIETAKDQLEDANEDYIRYKNEFKDGTVTKKDLALAAKNLETAKVNFALAQEGLTESDKKLKTASSIVQVGNKNVENIQKELNEARLELSYGIVYAPCDSIVLNVVAKEAQEIKKGDFIAELSTKRQFVIAKFSDEQIAKIKKGQKAKVKLENNKFKTIIGKVEEINGNDVKILLRKDSSRDLKEGLKVSARVKTGI